MWWWAQGKGVMSESCLVMLVRTQRAAWALMAVHYCLEIRLWTSAAHCVLFTRQIRKKQVSPQRFLTKIKCVLQVKLRCNVECNDGRGSLSSDLGVFCSFTANIPVWGINLTQFCPSLLLWLFFTHCNTDELHSTGRDQQRNVSSS